jgi:hypothetical protein
VGFALGLAIGAWAVERGVEKWEKGGDLLWVMAVEKFAGNLGGFDGAFLS